MRLSNLYIVGLLWLFVMMTKVGYGQKDSVKTVTNFIGWHVGLTPTAVVNIYPGVQVSLDYGLKNNRHVITNEIALLRDFNSADFIGFRYKPGFDYAYARRKVSFAAGIHMNLRYTSRIQSIFVTRANGQYTQEVEFNRNLLMLGICVQLQFNIKIDKYSKIAFGFGIGPGMVRSKFRGLPDNIDPFVNLWDENILWQSDRQGISPWVLGFGHLNFSTQIFRNK